MRITFLFFFVFTEIQTKTAYKANTYSERELEHVWRRRATHEAREGGGGETSVFLWTDA